MATKNTRTQIEEEDSMDFSEEIEVSFVFILTNFSDPKD